MAGLVGADVEELRSLSADVSSGSRELRDLGVALARSIEAAEQWRGPDAERCKQEWGGLAQVRLVGVAEALESAGRLLEQEAREQEVASDVVIAGRDGWWYGVRQLGEEVLAVLGVGRQALRSASKLWQLGRFFAALLTPTQGLGQTVARLTRLRDALEIFRNGPARPMLGVVGRVANRLFLPLTVLSGIGDVVTGGDRTGWRDVGTRVAGAAGAAGAATILAAAAGVVAVTPVGLAVAGVAVVGYGLWSLGNYAYDHREQLGRAWERARDWAGRTGRAYADSHRAWARHRLAGPATAVTGVGP